MRRDVFQAIADPTRRDILLLIARKPLPLNSIAGNFEVSRPAISKHIRILTECGIVTIQTRGRERYCEVQADKLSEVTQWVERFRVFWMQKLDALEEFLQKTAPTAAPAAVPSAPVKKSSTKAALPSAPVKKAAPASAPAKSAATAAAAAKKSPRPSKAATPPRVTARPSKKKK